MYSECSTKVYNYNQLTLHYVFQHMLNVLFESIDNIHTYAWHNISTYYAYSYASIFDTGLTQSHCDHLHT